MDASRDGCPGVTNFVEISTGQLKTGSAPMVDVSEAATNQGFFVVVP